MEIMGLWTRFIFLSYFLSFSFCIIFLFFFYLPFQSPCSVLYIIYIRSNFVSYFVSPLPFQVYTKFLYFFLPSGFLLATIT